jgi:primosomal protein N' (replication factor Y)
MFVEVIIPLALPKNYTWSVPEVFRESLKQGQRVEVVLGRNKKYAGIAKKIHREKPRDFEPKDILNILDEKPVVSEEHLRFWEWMADYYMCTEGEVMAAALPAHLKLTSETQIVYNEEAGDDFSMLDTDEFVVAEALLIRKQLSIAEVQQLTEKQTVYPIIKRLIEKKICFVWESLKHTYSPKKESFVLLDPAYHDEQKLSDALQNVGRAPKQMELLLAYLHLIKTSGEVTKSELIKKSGASDAQLKGLVDKGILLIEKRAIDRIRSLPKEVIIDFSLSGAQQTALGQLHEQFGRKQVCLLHGVTSSGKTLLYIRLIEDFIKSGKQVLYLLPEIALTGQIIRRLQKHFGGLIGVYHSKFSPNERIEVWNKVSTGELKVVLGARSALFLPFSDPGLIIVDEEHDTSFKQYEPAPRYHARDSAIYLSSLYGAKLLLGSATPSIESYHNGATGKYGLVTLSERFGGTSMPAIRIVDTSAVVRKTKTKVIVGTDLEELLTKTIGEGGQAILFQNRRGYSPYQICTVCAWIPRCRNCDVTLTFHKRTQKLHCHYCGTQYAPLQQCLACGSDKMLQSNFGTERIEELLEEKFPTMKIGRMDVDSLRGKTAHDHLIQQFEDRRIDVLVGTQMVVKGLDFENVRLVGIVDADNILGFSDFRVNERGFQMMEQVSGRAGRKEHAGIVLIQAMNTKHPVLGFVASHDYNGFFETELAFRKQFFYPPFSRILRLVFKHRFKDIVDAASLSFAAKLSPEFNKWLTGPAEPIVGRVKNQYLMELMLKLPKDSSTINRCKQLIREEMLNLHAQKKFRSVVVIPDVDPVN